VGTVYAVWQSTMSSPDFQVVQREMAPKLAAFSDKITQNEKLFNRIETVYNSPEKKKLNGEQQRLVWLDYTNFVRSGAKLDAKSKARLTEINQQLATLFTKFSNNVLWEEGNQFVQIKNEADLAGLPPSVRDAAAAAAAEKKQEGWLIINTRSSVEPFLTFSDRRDLREKVWRMFIMRGDNGDEHDNNATITQILQLRAERAKLLGYQTHAHWRVENQMAKTPERAMDLMMAVWKPAVQRVHEEVADMQALVAKEGATFQIAPWDYRYYMERVRKAKYDLDQNEVKPYLQLDKLREAIHWVAGELFNFKFTPAPNVPVAHPDIKVWEVSDKTTGKHIGLWYFDPFARPGKRSGAWMNAYRSQERVNGEITTIVSNNANFVKANPASRS
jgi:peptidyl-dipeptidase Dcp